MRYELRKNRKPNISYFHAFGSKCFVHNNRKKILGTFDGKSDKGIFLGYSHPLARLIEFSTKG